MESSCSNSFTYYLWQLSCYYDRIGLLRQRLYAPLNLTCLLLALHGKSLLPPVLESRLYRSLWLQDYHQGHLLFKIASQKFLKTIWHHSILKLPIWHVYENNAQIKVRHFLKVYIICINNNCMNDADAFYDKVISTWYWVCM